MEKRLLGQTAVVTGGNTGIGAAMCEAMGAEGANIVVNYHSNLEKTDALLARLEKLGAMALAVQGDVSKEADVIRLVQRSVEAFGRIDILCANAGIQADGKSVEMTLEKWQKVIDVNLTGAFLCAREAARRFLQQGVSLEVSRAAGKIIFTSSVHEEIPWESAPNYCAAKGGLKMLMRSMAQELAPARIRVMAIGPGAIKTKINAEAWETKEKEQAEVNRYIPYGRWGVPMDIGKAAAWLVSDEADYITGTTLFVDGGMLLYPSFREE